MNYFILKGRAALEALDNVQPVDTPECPFDWRFVVECTSCGEEPYRAIVVNLFAKFQVENSERTWNFRASCEYCPSTHLALIRRTKGAFREDCEDEWVDLLYIVADGIKFKKFREKKSIWHGTSEFGSKKYENINLEYSSWCDYDMDYYQLICMDNARFQIILADDIYEKMFKARDGVVHQVAMLSKKLRI